MRHPLLGETVGIQDQIAAAFGGLNFVEIAKNGEYKVDPVIASKDCVDQLESHLLLCFTGISRLAAKIAKQQVASFTAKQHVLTAMQDMVTEGRELLINNQLREFADLLDESWSLKRSISPEISMEVIDQMYQTARRNGALGGKLLGAGGGGFMLLVVPPSQHERVKSSLPGSVFVPIKVDWSGSQIALYQPTGI